ncbi:unnamed protein product [Trichobilharzia regenti]|nr:unnamed protein product [Trichobilharzia regenti]
MSDPQQYQYTVYSNLPITNGLSWITQQSDAYLTPIQSSVSFYDCESPTKIHSTNDTDSNNISNHLNHSKLTSSNLPDFMNTTHNIQSGDVCTTQVSALSNCDDNNNNNNSNNVLKEVTDTNHIGASSVDESMYELSEEEMREIDATVSNFA